MKNKQVFKTFSDLSFDGNGVSGADAPAQSASQLRPMPESGLPVKTADFGNVREMLYQRYTAPFVVAAPYRHWGINE